MENDVKVWVNTDCKGHYPVGFAAVVCSDTAEGAAYLLNEALFAQGLSKSAEAKDMKRFFTSKPSAVILNNGDY
jgi:hypothetical protein